MIRFLAQGALFPEWRITDAVGNAWDAFENATETIFDALDTLLDETLVSAVQWVLLTPPPIVVILAFALIALWARGWKLAVGTFAAFYVMESIGYFEPTMESLAIVLVAALVALVVGIPLGILATRSRTASRLMRPVLDFMQTMPSFVYLMLGVALVGAGAAGGVLASVIFAMPPAVRLTELGIRQVDEEVVEAAHAFGASPNEILRQVQLPLAMPTIMAGVNQVIMLSLSMVVISGLAGAGGIAGDVVEGVTRLDFGLGIVAGLCVVTLAVFLDRVTSALADPDAGAAAAA